ncbi:phosphate ABC transporter ATP-binding protein PstB [Lapidilactobacillus wuchangensis]|uniref:phosphate ABC transporter ATP-binding protein PstB n=1 Tax=Lapidilactobacillus wuchangensis TaxID=2486001 RepID=UPI000F78BE40|nr:phosphate ABC transporter ATP-binding protein PstB [Lapidilactobacillus wuchangensis]
MTEKIPLLTATNVSVSYGQRQTVHDLSLNFPENQITAIMGPSGCGKSTFLRCLNRSNDLLPDVHVGGEIRFRGDDIYQKKVNPVVLRTKIGMVYQQPTPFPFSIYDNVAFSQRMLGLHDRKMIREIVETSLQQAAIWDEVKDRLDTPAQALSGGQQQRICLASVLAAKPEVILLDEPTSALDPIASAKIEATLIELKKLYTIIIVTHNLQQASRISDQVAFLLNGQLVETGPTAAFFMNPREQATSDYLNGKFG